MIDMIGITNFFAAIVACTFLGCVLSSDISIRVGSFRSARNGLPLTCFCSPFFDIPCVQQVFGSCRFLWAFLLGFANIIGEAFGVAAVPFLCRRNHVLPVLLVILFATCLAIGIMSIPATFIFRELGERLCCIALSTMLSGCGILGMHVESPFDLPRPRPLQRCWDNSFSPVILPQVSV